MQCALPIVEFAVRGGDTGEEGKCDESGEELGGVFHDRWTAEGVGRLPGRSAPQRRGLLQRRPGNLLKSASLECNSA